MDPRGRLGALHRVVVGLGVGLALAAAMSCSDPGVRERHCDYTLQRCQTVCDYWCDYYWGCYPRCWDQCWEECYVHERPPEATPPPPRGDAGAPPDALPDGGGAGVLCSACSSNSDCAPGALCIVRGGPPVPPTDGGAEAGASGRGFCGDACTVAGDCPEGFVCTQIGSNRQCVPSSGSCP